MLKITRDNIQELDLNGIVIGVPKDEFPSYEFTFVTECAYLTKGKHGYPEQGYHPDNSSFYHIVYNMEDGLNNGLWMNCTSRFTLEDSFRFKYCNYYKFDNMKEFCEWYLSQNSKTNNIKQSTIRDADDEIHVECRFADGEKFAGVTIDKKIPCADNLAQIVSYLLNNQMIKEGRHG